MRVCVCGQVMLNAHVERILVDNQSAAGVALKGGKVVKARKGVVSNASIWNTKRLLPSDLQEATATSVGASLEQPSDHPCGYVSQLTGALQRWRVTS